MSLQVLINNLQKCDARAWTSHWIHLRNEGKLIVTHGMVYFVGCKTQLAEFG